jgi:hypothetical protein
LTSFTIVPVRTNRSPNFGARAAILLGVALAIATTPIATTSAVAELRVRGSAEAVRIEARDTSVAEILSALSRTLNMHYQSSANLDKRLSGTYSGPLSRVLARVLDGYNFVLKTDNGSIALTVLGPPNAAAAIAAPSVPKVVRQPAEGAVPARGAAEDLARPQVSASTAAPSPTVERAEGPSFPTPARPSSGAAPAPVPELRQSEAAAPAPPAPGSKAPPAPEPGRPADASSPLPAPTPPSASPQAK